jgi:hypothetical protein
LSGLEFNVMLVIAPWPLNMSIGQSTHLWFLEDRLMPLPAMLWGKCSDMNNFPAKNRCQNCGVMDFDPNPEEKGSRHDRDVWPYPRLVL